MAFGSTVAPYGASAAMDMDPCVVGHSREQAGGKNGAGETNCKFGRASPALSCLPGSSSGRAAAAAPSGQRWLSWLQQCPALKQAGEDPLEGGAAT